MLCRVSSYFGPGFPSPAMRYFMGFGGWRLAIGLCVLGEGDLHCFCCVRSWLLVVGFWSLVGRAIESGCIITFSLTNN